MENFTNFYSPPHLVCLDKFMFFNAVDRLFILRLSKLKLTLYLRVGGDIVALDLFVQCSQLFQVILGAAQ